MPSFQEKLGPKPTKVAFFAFICIWCLIVYRLNTGTPLHAQNTFHGQRREDISCLSFLPAPSLAVNVSIDASQIVHPSLNPLQHVPVATAVSENKAKKNCGRTRSFEIIECSQDQHQTGLIKISAAHIASHWDKVLPYSDKTPDKCGSSIEDHAFVKAMFRAKFVTHAQPCANIVRVGGSGTDGSKYICNTNVSKGDCVVFSLGSRKDFSFEEEIVAVLQCKVHTFDCTVGEVLPDEVPAGVFFHPWCIGDEDTLKVFSSDLLNSKGKLAQYYTIRTVMRMLGYTYVDILKMDIERHEFAVLKTLACPGCFGQAAIELHLHNAYGMFGQAVTYEEWNDVWDALVCENGLHPFSYDSSSCACCGEFSFVSKILK